jgi:hypothetical protein
MCGRYGRLGAVGLGAAGRRLGLLKAGGSITGSTPTRTLDREASRLSAKAAISAFSEPSAGLELETSYLGGRTRDVAVESQRVVHLANRLQSVGEAIGATRPSGENGSTMRSRGA